MRLPVETSPHVAVSRDGKLIAVTQGPGQILLLGKDGVVQKRINAGRPSPNAVPSRSVKALKVAVSPAADRMAVACPVDDEVSEVLVLSKEGEIVKRLRLVFPASKTVTHGPRPPLAKREDDATDVFPGPDGETLAISIVTGTLDAQQRLSCLWNVRTGKRLTAFPEGAQLRGFDPTGHWFATSNAAGQVTVWDAHSGKPARTFQVPPVMGEFDVKIHPSGQHAAVLSDGVLTFWDVEQGQQLAIIERPGHFTEVNCVSHHEKAGVVASGGKEGVILLWDRETGELRRSLPLEAASVTSLQFHPAGDRLVFVAPDRLALIDLEGRQLWTLDMESRGWRLPVFAFHPSGGFLAAGTEDGQVVFVDADTGKPLPPVLFACTCRTEEKTNGQPAARFINIGSAGGNRPYVTAC